MFPGKYYSENAVKIEGCIFQVWPGMKNETSCSKRETAESQTGWFHLKLPLQLFVCIFSNRILRKRKSFRLIFYSLQCKLKKIHFSLKEPISKLLKIVKASSLRSAKGSVFSCYPAGSSFKLPFAVLCDVLFAIFWITFEIASSAFCVHFFKPHIAQKKTISTCILFFAV